MLYKLLSVSKFPRLPVINIGDYVQALAAAQYYPRVDGFLDRDMELKDYHGEPCKMIMNGWYMHNPSNWPPSGKIEPLFVSLHLNAYVMKKMLSPESIAYLKKREPIGCRDLNTLQALKNCGVEAYFSGCLTLTLGKSFHSEEKDDKTYIVDPLIDEKLNARKVLQALAILARHPSDLFRLCTEKQLYLHRGWNRIIKILKTALYYREYSRVFGRETVMNSTYVCQENKFYKKRFQSDRELLEEAERLVRLYAKARLVITSRIHCALPCLGLGTPVIFIEREQDVETSSCRFGGLHELLNVVKLDKGGGILKPEFETELPITKENHPANKETWRNLADDLDKRCREFIK